MQYSWKTKSYVFQVRPTFLSTPVASLICSATLSTQHALKHKTIHKPMLEKSEARQREKQHRMEVLGGEG